MKSLLLGGQGLEAPGHHRDAGMLDRGPAGYLVPHQPDGLRRGTDENQPLVPAGLGENLRFRKKAIARMDGLGSAFLGGIQGFVDSKIAFLGGRRTEAVGLIRHSDVHGMAVRLGENDHRRDAQVTAGADDPDGYFSPIGDQDLLEHTWLGLPTLGPDHTGLGVVPDYVLTRWGLYRSAVMISNQSSGVTRHCLQGYIAVFARGIGVPLVGRHLQGADEPWDGYRVDG